MGKKQSQLDIETTGKDLAEFAVSYGMSQGATYADARIIDLDEENFTLRNGMLLNMQNKHRCGLGVRVLVNGTMSFASTERLTKESIQNIIQDSVRMAKASGRTQKISLSPEKTVQTRWDVEIKQPINSVSSREKIKFFKTLDKTLKKEVGSGLISRILVALIYTERKFLATSEGTRIYSTYTLPTFNTVNTAKGPGGRTEQRFFGIGGMGGWEWFLRPEFEQLLIDDNRGMLAAAERAENRKFDHPVDVIVSGEVSGIMAHENVGHPSEADRILGREGAMAGESFYSDLLKEGKIGEIQLGTEYVNIIDDPSMPGLPGSYPFDDEGVASRPRYLIKKGYLNELLTNREFAARLGLHSNAAARAVSFNFEPLTRMANTYFAPGDYASEEEMAEDIKEGMYMKSFTEWNIDDRRFQSKYVGMECYLIENGRITDTMVRRPVLELTTKGILGNVDAVGKKLHLPMGVCGKADPMQGIPVAIGGAPVRIRNIRVGGMQ
jgi:TldD protein